MKKLLVMLSIILVMGLFADKVKIKWMPNFREEADSKSAKKELVLPVLSVAGHYYKVKITSGDHTGKIGYMYKKYLDLTNKTVAGQGTALRDKPTKKGTFIANVGAGRTFEIIKVAPVWYETSMGWIHKDSVESIKDTAKKITK